MENFKGFFASKTVWGAIVVMLSGVAGIFGYSVDAQAQASLVEIGTSIVSAIGGIFILFARVRATKRIGKN